MSIKAKLIVNALFFTLCTIYLVCMELYTMQIDLNIPGL